MIKQVILPEIIDVKSPLASMIHILDENGKKIKKIQSLNTKTLVAKIYKFAEDGRTVLKDGDKFITEDVQLENIIIEIKPTIFNI